MWPYPKVLAHRGGGSLAPENTIAALRCGLAHGFHAVEFDVMLAKDGVPVLMHDPQLGRTLAGCGNVFDFTAQQLAAMDAGAWFGAQFVGEAVPLYAQVVEFCRLHQIWMNVEIKPASGFEEETGRVLGSLTARLFADRIAANERADRADLPLLSSFSFAALMAAKKAAPAIPRGWLLDVMGADWLAQARTLDAVALHTNQKNLTEELAQAVKQAGLGLFCYTVNTPDRARELIAWGVDGFCTDRIDLIGPEFPD